MIKQTKVNQQNLSKEAVNEILEACNRKIKNSEGKEDAQEGIKIFKKYFDKTRDHYDIDKPLPGQGEWNPLAFATFFGKAEEVKALLTLGANSKIKLNNDITVLHVAATEGKPVLCNYYLRGGVDVNSQSKLGQTPMMNACEAGHLDVVKILLNAKPNIMIKDNDALTCLDYGQKEQHYSIISYIEYFYLENKLPLKDVSQMNHKKVAKI